MDAEKENMESAQTNEDAKLALAEAKTEFRHVIQVALAAKNTAANTPTDRRGEIADVLTLRNILTAISINQLLEPASVEDIPSLSSPDPLSISVLVRSMAEAHLTLYGVASLVSPTEEAQLRLLWWDWHELNERIRSRDTVKSQRPGVEKWDQKKAVLAQKISSHPSFGKLPDDLKSWFNKGDRPRRPTFETTRKLAEVAGIHPERFEALYQVTSAAAHTEPIVVGLLSRHEPDDEAIIRSIKLQVSFATAFLAFTVRDFALLFPKGKEVFDDQFRKILFVWSHVLSEPF
jgi:hypothetical protein